MSCRSSLRHSPRHSPCPSLTLSTLNPVAGQLELEFETKRDEFRAVESEKLPARRRGVPRWELLSRLPPPREQVSQLKQQMREAVSRMRAKGTEKKDSGVVPIFNPSPGRYQMETSPDLSDDE